MRWLAAVALALVAGCYSPSAKLGVPCASNGACPSGQHCDMTVDPPLCAAADARPADAAPDAPPTCANAGDCTMSAPVCDPTTSTCRGCISDADCANGGGDVCLEYEGTCHNANSALYIGPTGSGSTCSKANPCTFTAALNQAANNQRIIVVLDGTYATQFNVQSYLPNTLAISGTDRDPAGAVITTTNPQGIIVQPSQKDLVIEGITVRNCSSTGIDSRGVLTLSRVAVEGNATLGVTTTGSVLTIRDSIIKGNMTRGIDVTNTTVDIQRTQVIQNLSGGIDISTAGFTIESSIIADNGTATSTIGGLRFQNVAGKTPQVFQFNTVANNASSGVIPNGVECDSALLFDSSIFYGDALGAMCTFGFSIIGSVDPLFVGVGDYHIQPTSPARDMANPAGTTTLDIDGEPRPQGGARDQGADEIP